MDPMDGIGPPLNHPLPEDEMNPLPEVQHSHHTPLQRLTLEVTSPDVLEKAVAIGVKALEERVKQTLQHAAMSDITASNNAEAAHWMKAIDSIQQHSKVSETIIAVVGNTGAGKSSVINAVLDEERLLPTNCLRACTASPTDDISIVEAAQSLHLQAAVSQSWQQVSALEQKINELEQKKAGLQNESQRMESQLEAIDDNCDVWEDLLDQIEQGKTVYAPLVEIGMPQETGQQSNQMPLTDEEVEDYLASLKTQRKSLRAGRRNILEDISELDGQIKEAQIQKDSIQADRRALCIKSRNQYSRGAIKRDFAAGIRELDEEAAIEQDEAEFDPSRELRDYDKVSQSLPVFCVSSRAYGQLRGRFEQEDFQDLGFRTPKGTEIPQLQQHTRKLTETNRRNASTAYLNELAKLLNSMKMWAASDGSRVHLDGGEREQDAAFLQGQLVELNQAFDQAQKDCTRTIGRELQRRIQHSLTTSIPLAAAQAVATAATWGAPKSEGGLHYATYKATVRRAGVFRGAAGAKDFNADLFAPVSRNLTGNWEAAFQTLIPAALAAFSQSCAGALNAFHEQVTARHQGQPVRVPGMNMLGQQLQSHLHSVGEIPAGTGEVITELQRDVNRQFTPRMQHNMQPAYADCVSQSGKGAYMRMKQAMANHLRDNRVTLFEDVTAHIWNLIEALRAIAADDMATRATGVLESVRRDYATVLVGADEGAGESVAQLRAQMAAILAGSDEWFAGIVAEGLTSMAKEDGGDVDMDIDLHYGIGEEHTMDEDGMEGLEFYHDPGNEDDGLAKRMPVSRSTKAPRVAASTSSSRRRRTRWSSEGGGEGSRRVGE